MLITLKVWRVIELFKQKKEVYNFRLCLGVPDILKDLNQSCICQNMLAL